MNHNTYFVILLLFVSNYSHAMEDPKNNFQWKDEELYKEIVDFVKKRELEDASEDRSPILTSEQTVLIKSKPVEHQMSPAARRKLRSQIPKQRRTQCGICEDYVELPAFKWHALKKHNFTCAEIKGCMTCYRYFPAIDSFTSHCVEKHAGKISPIHAHIDKKQC